MFIQAKNIWSNLKYQLMRSLLSWLHIRVMILSTSMLSLPACADQWLIKQTLSPNFISQEYSSKGFEPLSVYQFNNFANQPWLYELSGLAWDYDEQILYSISDSGYLLALKVIFEESAIIDIQLLSHHQLKDKNGNSLTGSSSDSEGLALNNHNNKQSGDTEIIISFEREPRVIRYDTQANYIETLPLPFPISNSSMFESRNKQLEAITEHSDNNFIIGTERPLKNKDRIKLYDLTKETSDFNLSDQKHGSLVGLTTLPGGNLLALERVFIDVFYGLRFHLHLLEQKDNKFEQTTLFSSAATDPFLNDNFEGITHHKENYFFMVSDDNQNSLQRTLLVYFQLSNLEY